MCHARAQLVEFDGPLQASRLRPAEGHAAWIPPHAHQQIGPENRCAIQLPPLLNTPYHAPRRPMHSHRVPRPGHHQQVPHLPHLAQVESQRRFPPPSQFAARDVPREHVVFPVHDHRVARHQRLLEARLVALAFQPDIRNSPRRLPCLHVPALQGELVRHPFLVPPADEHQIRLLARHIGSAQQQAQILPVVGKLVDRFRKGAPPAARRRLAANQSRLVARVRRRGAPLQEGQVLQLPPQDLPKIRLRRRAPAPRVLQSPLCRARPGIGGRHPPSCIGIGARFLHRPVRSFLEPWPVLRMALEYPAQGAGGIFLRSHEKIRFCGRDRAELGRQGRHHGAFDPIELLLPSRRRAIPSGAQRLRQ